MLKFEELEELKPLCPDLNEMSEGGKPYVLLPALNLPPGSSPAVVDGLLCPHEHSGYPTRLFLSQIVVGKGANWNSFRILDRTWYSPSWKEVPADLRLMEILLGHLRTYR